MGGTNYGHYGRQPPHILSGLAKDAGLLATSAAIIGGAIGTATLVGAGSATVAVVAPLAVITACGVGYVNNF